MPGGHSPYVSGSRPPTLEEIRADPSIVERLSPQETEYVLKQLSEIPTPVANLSTKRVLNPFKFFRDVLGWRPTPAALRHGYKEAITSDQRSVVESVMKNKYTAVTAGHGTGKTHIAAALALWFYHAFGPNAIVITTASSQLQVRNVLWSKIRKMFFESGGRIEGTCLETMIKSGYPEWYIIGFATRGETTDFSATRFHGFHAPYVLVIIDEATAVDDDIWEGAEGIVLSKNNRILALGNPTDPTSAFRKRCSNPNWHWVRMDCRDHPNVIHDDPDIIPGGAVTREWIEGKLLEYGGESSPGFKAKVTGEWPDSSIDAVIPLQWIDAANTRWSEWRLGGGHETDGKGVFLGLDVAREGGDYTVLSKCGDGVLQPEILYAGRDTDATFDMLKNKIQELGARMLVLDDTGVGGGVTDRLRRAQRDGEVPGKESFRIVPVNFSENANNEERFHRRKDEMWWMLRESLQREVLALPSETEVRKLVKSPPHVSSTEQLTKAVYIHDNRERIDILDRRIVGDERTVHMSKRSPDIVHSYILAHYGWAMSGRLREVESTGTEEEYTKRRFKKWMDEKLKDAKKRWEKSTGLARRKHRERVI